MFLLFHIDRLDGHIKVIQQLFPSEQDCLNYARQHGLIIYKILSEDQYRQLMIQSQQRQVYTPRPAPVQTYNYEDEEPVEEQRPAPRIRSPLSSKELFRLPTVRPATTNMRGLKRREFDEYR